MISITRKFTFDSGHRVLGHEGKCRHLHGHTYTAEVTVVGPELDGLGRVVDFSVIKDKVGKWIDSNWDHNFLCHINDPLLSAADREFILGTQRIYVMPGLLNPTAENMAMNLFNIASALLAVEPYKDLRVVHVRIHETASCYADYGDDPQI